MLTKEKSVKSFFEVGFPAFKSFLMNRCHVKSLMKFFLVLKTTEERTEWRNFQQAMKKALSDKHVDTEARQLCNGTSYFLRYFDIQLLSFN